MCVCVRTHTRARGRTHTRAHMRTRDGVGEEPQRFLGGDGGGGGEEEVDTVRHAAINFPKIYRPARYNSADLS